MNELARGMASRVCHDFFEIQLAAVHGSRCGLRKVSLENIGRNAQWIDYPPLIVLSKRADFLRSTRKRRELYG
jgi:hypothetical protein